MNFGQCYGCFPWPNPKYATEDGGKSKTLLSGSICQIWLNPRSLETFTYDSISCRHEGAIEGGREGKLLGISLRICVLRDMGLTDNIQYQISFGRALPR